jgi:hypothetical protein
LSAWPETQRSADYGCAEGAHARARADRALADLTRTADTAGRGVTYAYVCGLASGREYPTRRSMELIAASLDLEPAYFAEYPMAELRHQLNGREVGFDTAWQRYSELIR